MLLLDSDIKEITNVLLSCSDPFGHARYERDVAISYLALRPYLLFHLGYDEARVFSAKNDDARAQINEILHNVEQDREVKSDPFKGNISHEVILRDVHTKKWHLLYYIWGDDPSNRSDLTIAFAAQNSQYRAILVSEYLQSLRNPGSNLEPPKDRVVFPTLWVPPSIPRSNILASNITTELLLDLQRDNKRLQELTWQQLEDIVAELLRQNGLDIHVTKRTRDGGRDIIAHGEFSPGFKSTLAVEVTQMKEVGLHKVARALYQNRHFPSLMVATSGRFTAGVIQEKNLPENNMRGSRVAKHMTESAKLLKWNG